MSEHNNGGPAFPVQEFNADGTPANLEVGMWLRDYFAAKAMPVMLREILECGLDPVHPANALRLADASSACYVVADAMLKAREGGQA